MFVRLWLVLALLVFGAACFRPVAAWSVESVEPAFGPAPAPAEPAPSVWGSLLDFLSGSFKGIAPRTSFAFGVGGRHDFGSEAPHVGFAVGLAEIRLTETFQFQLRTERPMQEGPTWRGDVSILWRP